MITFYTYPETTPIWLTFLALAVVMLSLLSLVGSFITADNVDLAGVIPRYQEKISQGITGDNLPAAIRLIVVFLFLQNIRDAERLNRNDPILFGTKTANPSGRRSVSHSSSVAPGRWKDRITLPACNVNFFPMIGGLYSP